MVEGSWSKREIDGLEVFFQRGAVGHPPRWKMALLTWLGVFPSVVVWSAILGPHLQTLHRVVATAVVTGFVVVTLAWGVMPLLTRLFGRWLRASDGLAGPEK